MSTVTDDNSLSVDLLLVTALSEELNALLDCLPLERVLPSNGSAVTYHLGAISNRHGTCYSVGAFCLNRMGNPDAAALTAAVIQEVTPSYVLMFGLAGGYRDRVRLGDVIIATHIFYYEQTAVRPSGTEIRPLTLQTDSLLRDRFHSFASRTRGERDHNVRFGPFAVGEEVVADAARGKELRALHPKLLGFEMESYGVAQAATNALVRPRFIAIRGVCDFGDEEKDDDSRSLALENARNFLLSFLEDASLPLGPNRNRSERVGRTFIAIHHLSLKRRQSMESLVDSNMAISDVTLVEELLLDQLDLYANGSLANPAEAFRRQADLVQRLDSLLEKHAAAEIGYFGLAHIPLIFHAGHIINRREVSVFATNRQTGAWEPLDADLPINTLHTECVQDASNRAVGDVTIRFSISYLVNTESVEEAVPNPIAEYHLYLECPATDVVVSEEQLNSYARAFHEVLIDIQRRFPNSRRIHLFFAGPPTLAFRCGQQISKTADPEVIVYNYSVKDSPRYGWALNIMTGEIIDRRT